MHHYTSEQPVTGVLLGSAKQALDISTWTVAGEAHFWRTAGTVDLHGVASATGHALKRTLRRACPVTVATQAPCDNRPRLPRACRRRS